MKYSELRQGEIYHVEKHSSSGVEHTFRASNNGTCITHLCKSRNTFYIKTGDFSNETTIREATYEEKEHFLQCERARKYVEYKPELVNYEIY